MDSVLIKNGYIVDPLNKREGKFDILIDGSRIKKVAKNIKSGRKVIDANDKIVIPGLIDMHVHLRQPGREDTETIASGTIAAVSGGVTSVCVMPNTNPAIDNPHVVRMLKEIIKKDAHSNVFIIGAITKNRRGERLVDIEDMRKEGVIGLSDDGNSIQDEDTMFKALKKAKENGLLLISHCEDTAISKRGVVNDGIIATKLGLRGIPKEAEYKIVERDIRLAKRAKSKIHIAHVSCKESVDIIRKAKKKGFAVTAETAPHYFCLQDSCCVTYDTRTKVNPPLRSKEDVEAIKEALMDGTIDVIASDHAPHGKHEKEIEFEHAAFGIIGLETLLALSIMGLTCLPPTSSKYGKHGREDKNVISWSRLVELVSLNPARILGLRHKGSLSVASDADITIIDPYQEWTYAKDAIKSKSKNSPFIDWRFKGKVTDVIIGGKVVFSTTGSQ